jgi:hypothetical protein
MLRSAADGVGLAQVRGRALAPETITSFIYQTNWKAQTFQIDDLAARLRGLFDPKYYR